MEELTMYKVRDFCCLLAGVILLMLAFQLRGFAEEAQPWEKIEHVETAEKAVCCYFVNDDNKNITIL